jgi:hypothetical protein
VFVRAWFDGLTGPALFLYYFLGFGILFGLIGRFVPQAGLLAGVLFAAFMTLVTLNSRRKLGGASLLRQVSLATSKGVLPGLTDPNRWLAVLTHRRASLRRQQLIAAIVFAVVGICVIPPFWEIARIDKLRLRISRDYGVTERQDARQR